MTRSRDPEWLAHFMEVVKTSKLATEAAARLGYAGPGTVRYHVRRLGMEYPREWSLRPDARVTMQRHIPEVIIPTTVGRRWVAGLVQGEGCIQSAYRVVTDVTYLELDISMVDPAPIEKLSGYYGLPPPTTPTRNHDWNLQWRKNIQGLRALRVLREIEPFLLGEKLKEAEKALSFFDPSGNHKGCYRNGDIWPREEFPLRSKRRGSNYLRPAGGDLESHIPDDVPPVGLPRFAPAGQIIPDADGMGPNQRKVPQVIIESVDDRAWVAALLQGEGATQSHYVRESDSTAVDIAVGMTDFAPVFKFSELVGLRAPTLPRIRANPHNRPLWRKEFTGLRAYRVLQEIQPFMVGEKFREVEKALAFFGPLGTRRGCFRPAQIWPVGEFPLRRRLGRASGQGFGDLRNET